MGNQILLPPGRLVEGNVYKSSTLGMNGQIKAKPEFYFAVAVAKTDPRIPEVWEAYKRTAQDFFRGYRNVMAAIEKEDFRPYQGFAWKISNGDDADRVGKPGQAGCWIFKFKTTWDIKVVDANNVPINPTLLRTGFWCDVLANIDGNKRTDHQAGLFANPVFVRWLFPGYGEEIIPGPDADKAMGAAPTQLPPGAQQAQRSGPTGGYSGGNPGAGGGMGGAYPNQAPAHQAHVGHGQASATPSPQGGPGGWQQPAVNPQSHVAAQMPATTSPQTNTGTYSPSATGAAQPGQSSHPMHAGAHAQAAPASAMPAGAHSMPAQPASPTAYPSNSGGPGGQGGMAPPVHGFAHGNPGGQ